MVTSKSEVTVWPTTARTSDGGVKVTIEPLPYTSGAHELSDAMIMKFFI